MARRPLDKEQEQALAALGRAGEIWAVNSLVESYMGYVRRIARGYKHYGVPMSDLVQEGVIGLIQAIKRFDPAHDTRLSTYAKWWIKAAIQEHVVRSWSVVRIGTSTTQKAAFFRLRRMASELKDGAGALTEDVLRPIARHFGLSLKEITALAGRSQRKDPSLDETVRGDQDGRRGGSWLDRIADEGPTPEQQASDESEKQFQSTLIQRALSRLPSRERTIIAGRFLAEEKRPRDAIAADLGISRERVRQLEKAALEKLRRWLSPARRAI